MLIKSAQFILSASDVKKCPNTSLSEFAFAGRSNVGKSSLINMLTGFQNIARISSNPGKTQTMNFFLINHSWHLVDLPGYGFAKVSKLQREKWNKMIRNYLIERENLKLVFQLIDASVPPQSIDLDFTNWLGEYSIPFALIFTKTDKKNKTGSNAKDLYIKELHKTWETMPQSFQTSVIKKSGKAEILSYIESII